MYNSDTTFPGCKYLHSLAQKYKEYNKLRVRLSSKAAPRTPSKRTAARQPIQNAERTPRAQPNISTSTPVRKRREDRPSEDFNQANEFLSPQGPNFIGPTPQRDGIVLGLFDMLPAETPSKKRVVLGDVELNVLQTPTSKPQEAGSEASLESRARGERTPLSAGKRFLFNQFVTPKKRKLEEEHTPSSTMRGLSTPAFLRRDNALSVIDETNEPTPRPAPWKRRGLGRSLSDMIQAMRKDEDDRLDDEADIMRELEMEEEGIPIPKKPRNAEVLVEDSQVQMPLGPDRGLESEEEDEEEGSNLGPNGKPRKAWKKKGLKRQTRRVISRFSKTTKLGLVLLTLLQCDPTLRNLNHNRLWRIRITLRKNQLQSHNNSLKQKLQGVMLTQMTMAPTMQVTIHITPRNARLSQRKLRRPRVKQVLQERRKVQRERLRLQQMPTTGDLK